MFKKALQLRTISALFLLSLVFVLGGGVWAYSALRDVQGPLIIHFNNFVGINQIGSLTVLLGVGAVGAVAVLINFFIALELEARDRFLGKLVVAATLLFSILLFISFAAIISVN